jgi:hypothetical protein
MLGPGKQLAVVICCRSRLSPEYTADNSLLLKRSWPPSDSLPSWMEVQEKKSLFFLLPGLHVRFHGFIPSSFPLDARDPRVSFTENSASAMMDGGYPVLTKPSCDLAFDNLLLVWGSLGRVLGIRASSPVAPK